MSQEKSPALSVVMPAYNSAAFIAEAMQSVLAQTWEDLELIVVDDGSRDETPAIAARIAAADPRVTLIEQPNSGRPSAARNTGLARARGRYLAFLDSDDVWFPDRVARMIAGLEAHPHWLAVFHDLKLVAEDGSDLGRLYLADADFLGKAAPWLTDDADGWRECSERFFVFMSLHYAAVHTQSIMIARERLSDPRVDFDASFVVCEDNDLWIRVAMQGRLGYLDAVLSAYRQHGSSVTRDPYRYIRESVKFHEHNRRRIDSALNDDERRQYREKLAAYLRDLGYAAYRRGEMPIARDAYRRARALVPHAADLAALAKTLLPAWARRA